MGYTHYWRMTASIPHDIWLDICCDADKLIAASPVPIAWESDDERPPEVSRRKTESGDPVIRFNGVGEDGCETFWIAPEMKTRGRPYDIMVVAMLTMIADHAPQVEVSSDGDLEWNEGMEWASKVLGRKLICPLASDA